MRLSLFRWSTTFLCLAALFLQQGIAASKDYSPYPQPDSGYVTDHANLLTDSEELQLERWLLQVEEKSNVEIIIVTIESLSTYRKTKKRTVETFATGLFNAYGIGNMPKNDGLLLLVSRYDRKARIELGKYYGQSRNQDAMDIMQSVIIPEFKRHNYGAGITKGTEALIQEFSGMRVTFPWHIVRLAIAAVLCLLIGLSCFKNGKRGWGYVFVGIAIILFLSALYFLREVNRNSNSSRGSSGSPGGSGGFGGGSSGGGGATGSW